MKIDNTVLKNFSYLTVLQVISVLAPLLTYPYLIRVLGDVYFGKVIWDYSITQLFVIIINFGFNITGTKEIAENNANKDIISAIASDIYIIKFLLFLFGLLVVLLLMQLLDIFAENKTLILLSYLIVIGEVFVPIWYFQGLEKMRFITIINGGAKILSTILIFAFVNSQLDYIYVPIFQLSAAVLAAVLSLVFLYRIDRIQFVLSNISFVSLRARFVEGLQFFASRLSSVIIERANIFIIQAYFGFGEVTYYDTASKIVNLFKIPYDLINQAVYPNIVKTHNMKLVKHIITFILFSGVLSVLIFWVFSAEIFELVYGEYSLLGAKILKILIVIAPLTGIGFFLGNTTLIIFGHYSKFNKSIVFAMLFYAFSTITLVITDSVTLTNIAILSVLTTFFWVAYRGFFVNKYKILEK